jgi:hypothetical protein
MQIQDNDLLVNDKPKSMGLTPTSNHHCIIIHWNIGDEEALRIPLSIHGVVSYFPTRKLTREEFEQSDLELRVDMTYETPEWDPTDTRFAVAEQSMNDDVGQLVETKERSNRTIVSALLCCHEGQDASAFALAIMNSVKVKMIKAVSSRKGLLVVGPKLLAKHWKIGIEAACCTLEATIQTCIRTTLHPTLSRRFWTNDRSLRYRRLSHEVYTDTMKAKSVSWFRQNKYAQVFCTRFGLTRIYPL